MIGRSRARRIGAAALAVAAVGCAERAPEHDPRDLPVWAVEDEPSLRIGVLEGDSSYVFQNVAAVVERPDGGIAVADAGTSEIAQYDRAGTFERRFGGRGEGPGEFRALSSIYPWAGDSLLAFDAWTGNVSVFDGDGAYARQMPAVALSGDSTFALDVWLYGRWWVEGAEPAARGRVRAALDRLPAPVTDPGYRLVRVARDGRLWIREPHPNADGTRTWTVADPEGSPVATIDLSLRFEPMDIRDDHMAGRWLGESDVHFVRAYALRDPGELRRAPAWVVDPEDAPPAGSAPTDDEFMERMRLALRALASAQEIHYSTAMTYTPLVDSLEWERPEGIVVDVVKAGTRGWVAVFTHPALDRICGLGYGFDVPPGWSPGEMVCGPVAGSAGEG